jgi:uncharacterized protein (DUF111 family)
MRILSLDCSSEFSGESLVGALADLGVSPSTFEWELSGLEIGDHHLHFDREDIQGARAVRFGVHGGILHVDQAHSSEAHGGHAHSGNLSIAYPKVQERIEAAKLSDFVKSHTLSILQRIANGQSELAKIRVDQLEFPEAQALQWVVTATLSCIGLDQLQVQQIYFQQTNRLQFPDRQSADSPWSRAILSKLSSLENPETSPLGAAILVEFGATFGIPPKVQSARRGHGLGPVDDQGRASLVQAILGEVE